MRNDLLNFLAGPLGLPGLLVAAVLLMVLTFGTTATRVGAGLLLTLFAGALVATNAALVGESNIWPIPYLGWTALAAIPALLMLVATWRLWRAKRKK